MAASKSKAEAVEDAVDAIQEEAKPAARVPKVLQRPSKPSGPFVNSSFAQRAKALGRGKLVVESESK